MKEPEIQDRVSPNEFTRNPRRQRWVWAVSMLAVAFLLSAAYHYRTSVLIGLAKLWIVDEHLAKADAIVVLGGGLENRPFAAARLFHDGFAPKILYMDVRLTATAELGIDLSEREATHRVLLSNNVPEEALVAIGKSVASTYDESQAVKDWIKQHNAKSVIIPTDLFHTRRARWLFRRELALVGAVPVIQALETRQYQLTNWWQTELGLIAFQNEIIKLFYYHLKY